MAVSARLVIAVAVVLTAFYFALPAGMGADAISVCAPLFAAGVTVVGIRSHRPSRTRAWVLLVVSFGLLAVAQATWALLDHSGSDTLASVGDAVHLAAVAVLLIALGVLGRDAAPHGERLDSIEAAIVGIAFGLGVWLAVVEPYLADRGLAFGDRVWAVLVPLLVVLALVVAMRTAVQDRFGVPATTLPAVGTGLLLVSDVAWGIGEMRGSLVSGGFVAALSIAPPLVIAAAALDPTMSHRKRTPESVNTVGLGRVVWLSVAALTPLTVLLTLSLAGIGTRTTRTVAALSAVVVVVLALTRMWHLVATVRSLTERRGQDRLAAMVEHSSDVVLLVDAAGVISYASPGLAGTLGHRPADWTGRSLVDLVSGDDRESAASELQRAAALPRGEMVKFEAGLVGVDGRKRWMEATIANLLGGDAVDGMVATFRDVTEQRDLQRRLSHRAFHDELTGLANRALFLERMDHALSLPRPDDDPVVVLFVDLDDFKSVNDALGHGVGDQVLRSIAARIRRVAGDADTPARLGGDEFALLLDDHGGRHRAVDVAEELLAALRAPVEVDGHDLAVPASVGVAVSSPGISTAGLLRDADIAMYEAKRAGKSQIKIFDPAMRLDAARHLEFRHDLGTAIALGQLRLVFQPIIDLRTRRVVGAEALLRWEHPTRGPIAPKEFIPIAERSGLIVTIGKWVLEESIASAVRWQGRGPQHVSINVSAQQVRSAAFSDHLRRSLADHDFDPQLLTLEIPESVLVEEVESGSGHLASLRELGVRIAIDDFGTGYCSLAYLQRFPVDIVKIDRRYVAELPERPGRNALARMILQLTAGLDIVSVAEGIERPDQLRVLRELGCDLGQGFLLSPPLESEQLEHHLGVVRDMLGA